MANTQLLRFAGALLIACAGASLVACDKSPSNSQAAVSAGPDVKGNVAVLRVGTSSAYPPFTLRDKDGKPAGYDVDLLNAVGAKLGYKIEWTTAEFSGLFGMLDTNRIDTIAQLVSVTPEREKKYRFSTPYAYSGAQLVVKPDSSVRTLEDLKGKTLGVVLGINLQQYASEWNAAHGNPFTLKTYQDNNGVYDDVVNGRLDAFIDSQITAIVQINARTLPLKLASDKPLYEIRHAYPFRNTTADQALADRFDKALGELIADGTLTRISDKWVGSDVSKH